MIPSELSIAARAEHTSAGVSRSPAHESCTAPASEAKGIWREVEVLLLVLLVLGVYFSRLTALTIRGEESRWARVAQEMLDSGDWVVPRQQGEPFPDRPPLNSWAMIAASHLTGGINLVSIRLPSATATLLTTLLVYWYCRKFLSRVGSFAAAAAFATMGQVMQLGRLAESDSLLTLCLTAALFTWHEAYLCRDNPRRAWILGYLGAALAGLAKGPQGPIYFVAITTVYLCLRRDWRFLFSRWHAVGLVSFALVLGAWQLPFLLHVGSRGTLAVWSEGGTVGTRFQYASAGKALKHWLTFPWEVLGCMLPWSLLLTVFASRWLRSRLGTARPMVVFLAVACLVTFPTCWIPADTRSRYFMSLFPCVASLVGVVVDRCWHAREQGWWPNSWHRFLACGTVASVCAALLMVVSSACGLSLGVGLGQAVSMPLAVACSLTLFGAAVAMYWSLGGYDHWRAQAATLSVAAALGMTYTGVVLNTQMRASNNPAPAIAGVRDLIPPGEQLISLGPVHHLFAYYYGQPIALQKLGRGQAAREVDTTYFCFAEDASFPPVKIRFAWQPVCEISCERARSDKPRTKVIIGRRLTAVADLETDEELLSIWPELLDPAARGISTQR